MATNEWGMLRDIFNEVADDHMQRIPPNTGGDPYQEAAGLANFAVAHAFRAVADKMRERGGMTPDELAEEWRKKLEMPQPEADKASSMTHERFVEAILGDMLDAGSKTIIAQAMHEADDDHARIAQEDTDERKA